MLKNAPILFLFLLIIACQKKPDIKKESTVKDIKGNVSEYAVDFAPLTTVYKKKKRDEI